MYDNYANMYNPTRINTEASKCVTMEVSQEVTTEVENGVTKEVTIETTNEVTIDVVPESTSEQQNEYENVDKLWDFLVSLDENDEFAKDAMEYLETAKEGTLDYDDVEKIVDHYEEQILGDNEEIDAGEFLNMALESGFINEDDLKDFEAIFDSNGDEKFSKEEIRTLVRAAFVYRASENAENDDSDSPFENLLKPNDSSSPFSDLTSDAAVEPLPDVLSDTPAEPVPTEAPIQPDAISTEAPTEPPTPKH